MDQLHGKSRRKKNGGRRRKNRDKRLYECGGYFSAPKLGDDRDPEMRRRRGGSYKLKIKGVQYANICVDKGRVVRAKILKVLSTPDNANYARQGLITKGTLLSTEIGEAKVISRPTQHAIVNAVITKPNK